MNNLTLIGMPGAGKSTVGIVLAKVLGYDFIDSDLLIQKEEGQLLWQIIERCGLDGFRAIEDRVNAQITVDQTVIATGGSVIYCTQAMEHLRSIGTIVYLKISCEELAGRLGDLSQRGVTIKPGQTLDDLYTERVPLYEKYADITVDITGLSVTEAIEKIQHKIFLQ
ncbi:MAG: shikimate kinase [Lachnospiraceae bacterium]|nr:shikimate kinase [Lachnospiraceae bacterium]